MTETQTTLDTIDAVLEDEQPTEAAVEPEVVDGEVVSDTAEEATTEAAPAKRTRKSKAERSAELQNVPAPAPVVEKSEFTRAKATKHTEKLRGSVEVAAELFVEAYTGRIWLALDYETWGEYLNGEIGEVRPRLPKAKRLELVGTMKTEAKMSQSAIAEALGVDQKTVSNDLRELRAEAAESGEEAPESESVGQDGKSYTRNTGNGRKPKEFIERVTSAVDKLDKAVGDLTDLTVEDEWREEVSRVAGRHRSDLARWVATFQGLLQQFEEAPDFEESAPAEDEAPASE